MRGQWEKYYDHPDRAAGTESGSSTEAYGTDEGKRVMQQLWQEAMGNDYQDMSSILDNQSMVSAT